jgi:aminoglycoside phosphotransferase (APT) family kinase protein
MYDRRQSRLRKRGLAVSPAEQLVDRAEVGRRLTDVLGDGPEPVIERVSTGHTNEMFRVTRGPARYMLRRPPRVSASRTASDMTREAVVLQALDRTDVPHPSVLASWQSDSLGVPFLLMSWIDGFSGLLPLPAPFETSQALCRELAFSLVDGLADLSRVDYVAAGLEGFGRPDGFLARQVTRWVGQLASYQVRDLPLTDQIGRWLEQHRPPGAPAGIVHGDYQWDNVLFAPDPPGRLAAIVDWDSATVGDPLIDLGWLLGLWDEPGEDAGGRDPRKLFTARPGMPTRAEATERYCARSGRSVAHMDYYRTLAMFKLACVIEGSYSRWIRGQSDDPMHATFEWRVPALLEKASRIASGDLP